MKLRTFLSILAVSLSLTGFSHGVLIWAQGIDDGSQDGNGDPADGLNDSSNYFGSIMPGSGVQEIGPNPTPQPGNPANTGGAGPTRDVDDAFYFEGDFGGSIGVIGREQYWERAITGGDASLRFHFNVPASLSLGSPGLTLYQFTIDFYNLDFNAVGGGNPNSAFDLTAWVDGVQVGGVQTHDTSTFGSSQVWTFDPSLLGGAAEQGPGFNHYVELRSTAVLDARWASLDYAQLDLIPEPSSGLLLLFGGLLPLLLFRRRRKG